MGAKEAEDRLITVATGKSRKETAWKNREMLWSVFAGRLRETRRTEETQAEYMRLSKARQDEIKDVGGFVGGTLAGGRRRAGSVISRDLVTLDMDTAEPGFWELFTLCYRVNAVLYSTHRHTAEKPRLRLVIPLDRPVAAAEYEAVSRRIAGNLGIEQFDDTTFSPERLMYWPSTSRDAEYVYEAQGGGFLSADELLASYRDWRDATQWPVSERREKIIRREIARQADPTEKPGTVGAFCRTYGLHEAIEAFLAETYTPHGRAENRYTYVRGSTSGGLIVYDNLFAWSHHGTDPAGGRLCNAFDLVRLHRFGGRDEQADKKTNASKLPSFRAMEEFAAKDAEVRRTLAREKLAGARQDFEGSGEDGEGEQEDPATWMEKLEADRKGNYPATYENLLLVMRNDPRLKGVFARNEFSDKLVLRRLPPWRKPGDDYALVRDDDEENLRVYLASAPWQMESRQKISDVLGVVSRENAFHPVKEFFKGLVWDGDERLETLFIDFLGALDTPLTRTLTRKMFVAAVRRVYHPGTPFDQICVLAGDQGIGKSKILEALAVCPDWFSCSLPPLEHGTKEAEAHTRGKLFIEIGELEAIRRAEVETLKNFISTSVGKFRPAFGKNEVSRPRQCVFWGSTNEQQFLKDASGERRFWIIPAGEERPKYPLSGNPRTVDGFPQLWDELDDGYIAQVWAEALAFHHRGESLALGMELKTALAALHEEYKETDGREGIVGEFLEKKLPEDWYDRSPDERRNYFLRADSISEAGSMERQYVSAAEVLWECFGEKADSRSSYKMRDMNRILRRIPGWRKGTHRKIEGYGWQRHYVKKW